jgi:hypothetical protein
MFEFAPAGLSTAALDLAAGLGGPAQVAPAAIAVAAAALAFGQAGALLLREHSEGLHVREGWHTLACSTLASCAIACREGAAWHRSAGTALAVHVELRSHALTQYASGRARHSMCLRLRVCRCA